MTADVRSALRLAARTFAADDAARGVVFDLRRLGARSDRGGRFAAVARNADGSAVLVGTFDSDAAASFALTRVNS